MKVMLKFTHKASGGFTMLEMLVALLIVSIGLLGVASLQARGQQFNYLAYVRTQATFLAYDIMDRIRINQKIPSMDFPELDYELKGRPPPLSSQSECDLTACNQSQLASYDKAKWYQQVEEMLPEGYAEIEWIDTESQYRITLCWVENRESSEDKQNSCHDKKQEWKLKI